MSGDLEAIQFAAGHVRRKSFTRRELMGRKKALSRHEQVRTLRR
jgi:hypothetical protein